MILKKGDIVKKKSKFKPKAIVVMVDEMSEVMSGNYKIVSSIQDDIASIARLGRAAGVHLVLATQRPSSNVINSDLKNNIQQFVILGNFDSSASALIFDEDISHMSKPEIKGRGFVKTGKDIMEFQSYYSNPENDFKYNETVETSFIKEDKENKSEERREKNHKFLEEQEKRQRDAMESLTKEKSKLRTKNLDEISKETDIEIPIKEENKTIKFKINKK